MSNVMSDNSSTTPKSTIVHRDPSSLPPSVEGPIHAILICHVPNLRWLPRYQYLCRSVTVKLSWWGEDDISAIFKPQTTDALSDQKSQPNTTVKYYIRSDLQQFSRYLIDALELVFKIIDTDTNRTLGTVKIQSLSILSVNNAIKGYHSIFSNKGDKLGELFVSLRIFLPGPQDSNENLAGIGCISDRSTPSSRRNSFVENNLNESISKDPPPGMRKYKELPTGKVVEELIERASRLRENLTETSTEKTSILKKTYRTKPQKTELLIDDMDRLTDNEHVYGGDDSILTDLDGFDGETSLLDDLLYGRPVHISIEKKRRSLDESSSSDSDQNDISLDKHKSDENLLSSERIQLLTLIRTARLRIDHLDLKKKIQRANKSRQPMSIEYQFPVILENAHNHITQGSEITKITSKQIESDHKVHFSHSSTYPCLITETNLSAWSNSSLTFKIYTQTNHLSQIGFARLSFEKIFTSDCLHFEGDLNLLDSTYLNHQQLIPDDIDDDFSIGHLHVMLEFNSDERDFSSQLNRLQIMENFQTKKREKTSSKQKKKSPVTKHCLVSENTNGLVVEIFFSVTEARHLQSVSKNSNLPPNPYFICRSFWSDETITSITCWASSSPKFHFEQKIPFLLTKSVLNKIHNNYLIIELWNKDISNSSDQLIGLIKVPLEQFYLSFQDPQISRVLLRAQYPVISNDSWLPIIDPFNSNRSSVGQMKVFLAMGTDDQILAFQKGQSDIHLPSPPITTTTTISTKPSSSPLIEHNFEIMIENLHNLQIFESMIEGECDCFIQYSFPSQNLDSHPTNQFQLQTIRTSTTLCTSNVDFHDVNHFRYLLTPGDALHKYFYAICQSNSPIEANIIFEVWARFYYPNIRDQILAKGQLSITKLCSLTTVSDKEFDEKILQSFRIPLEIIREDIKHKHQPTLPLATYAGDLLLTMTYKRMIIQEQQSSIHPQQSNDNDSQISLAIHIIRACGLKYAANFHARDDSRLNYFSQIGLNTYVKVTLSFLSDLEAHRTKTISRSFIPEYNQLLTQHLSLIWKNHENQPIHLIDMFEYGEIQIEVFHQIVTNQQKTVDIRLCHSKVPFKELIYRQTGIKGWFSLIDTIDKSESVEHCLGGIELMIRFADEIDREKFFQSAKSFGWINPYSPIEQTFLSNDKHVGCLFKLSIRQIELPIHLLSQFDSDRIFIFAQYRFFDKVPILTKRQQANRKQKTFVCQLNFQKNHFYLYAYPLLTYVREEKFEIQIWLSENHVYDYSKSISNQIDKYLGSIYVDLNVLLTQKEIHSILPIFKQGTKDLSEATVEIELTMENSSDIQTEDQEFEQNPQLIRHLSTKYFTSIIHIEQAAHLPNVYSPLEKIYVPPNSYVKYSTIEGHPVSQTQAIISSSKPQWDYREQIQLSIDYLFQEKQLFHLQIYHCQNQQHDQYIGSIAIDLTPLLSGLEQINGWYNIQDRNGNIQGQLKVLLVPKEDLKQFKQMKYPSTPRSIRSQSNHDESSSVIETDRSDQSYLMNNLRRQLSELDLLTERLKSRC